VSKVAESWDFNRRTCHFWQERVALTFDVARQTFILLSQTESYDSSSANELFLIAMLSLAVEDHCAHPENATPYRCCSVQLARLNSSMSSYWAVTSRKIG
jgi:hypothetical protein